ncbi:hypothetical protein [Mesorhizobium sp.]|uniref:hypothetical protein n=1 Tax=Mesorhizobium sp. TaxID=1871066 RepID=UPI0026005327|nr:hypothetical protein [Mesorhizobium sp.]
MSELDRDIEDAAAAVGVTVRTATETYVGIVPGHGFGFYKSERGWLYARQIADGSFEAPTGRMHREQTGQAIAASDRLDELAGSGVDTFPTAAEAIRTTLRNYLAEAGPIRKLSDFD